MDGITRLKFAGTGVGLVDAAKLLGNSMEILPSQVYCSAQDYTDAGLTGPYTFLSTVDPPKSFLLTYNNHVIQGTVVAFPVNVG